MPQPHSPSSSPPPAHIASASSSLSRSPSKPSLSSSSSSVSPSVALPATLSLSEFYDPSGSASDSASLSFSQSSALCCAGMPPSSPLAVDESERPTSQVFTLTPEPSRAQQNQQTANQTPMSESASASASASVPSSPTFSCTPESSHRPSEEYFRFQVSPPTNFFGGLRGIDNIQTSNNQQGRAETESAAECEGEDADAQVGRVRKRLDLAMTPESSASESAQAMQDDAATLESQAQIERPQHDEVEPESSLIDCLDAGAAAGLVAAQLIDDDAAPAGQLITPSVESPAAVQHSARDEEMALDHDQPSASVSLSQPLLQPAQPPETQFDGLPASQAACEPDITHATDTTALLLSGLHDQLASHSAELSQRSLEIARLESALRSSEAQLESALQAAARQQAEQEDLIAALAREREEARTMWANDVSSLRAQIEAVRSEISLINDAKAAAEARASAVEQEKEALKLSQAAQYGAAIQEVQDKLAVESSKLKGRIEELNREAEQRSREREEIERETAALREQLATLQRERAAAADLEKAKAQSESAQQQQIAELEAKLKSSKKQKRDLEEEIERLNKSAIDQIPKLNLKIQEMQLKLDHAKERLEEKAQELERRRESEAAQIQLNQEHAKMQHELGALGEQVKNWRERYDRTQEELNAARAKEAENTKSHHRRVEELQAKLAEAKEETLKYKAKIQFAQEFQRLSEQLKYLVERKEHYKSIAAESIAESAAPPKMADEDESSAERGSGRKRGRSEPSETPVTQRSLRHTSRDLIVAQKVQKELDQEAEREAKDKKKSKLSAKTDSEMEEQMKSASKSDAAAGDTAELGSDWKARKRRHVDTPEVESPAAASLPAAAVSKLEQQIAAVPIPEPARAESDSSSRATRRTRGSNADSNEDKTEVKDASESKIKEKESGKEKKSAVKSHPSKAAELAQPPAPVQPVLCFSSVKDEAFCSHLESVARRFGCEIVTDFSDSVTHVIAPPGTKTEKTLLAMAKLMWFMAPEWLQQCERAGKIVPEAGFGVRLSKPPFAGMKYFNDLAVDADIKLSMAKKMLDAGEAKEVKAPEKAEFILTNNREITAAKFPGMPIRLVQEIFSEHKLLCANDLALQSISPAREAQPSMQAQTAKEAASAEKKQRDSASKTKSSSGTGSSRSAQITLTQQWQESPHRTAEEESQDASIRRSERRRKQ